jgi:hypothetical protein
MRGFSALLRSILFTQRRNVAEQNIKIKMHWQLLQAEIVHEA